MQMAMSATTDAWSELYAAQTDAVGSVLTATIGAVASAKPVIPSESPFQDIIEAGGVGNEGELTLQMLASDFSGAPVQNSAATVLGRTLTVLDYKLNNGIYYITVGDANSRE